MVKTSGPLHELAIPYDFRQAPEVCIPGRYDCADGNWDAWPVENRELIVEYSFVHQPSTKRLTVITKTVLFEYPAREDVVRVPFSHAEWDVIAMGDALQVTYTMKIDPGGSVPAWLINMSMADGPHESFTKLKKLLE